MGKVFQTSLQHIVSPSTQCVFIGLLYALAFPPYLLWISAFVALPWLFSVINHAFSVQKAAVYGLIFGFFFSLGNQHFIYTSVGIFQPSLTIFAPVATFIFMFLHGLCFSLMTSIYFYLQKSFHHPLGKLFFFVILLSFKDFIFSLGFVPYWGFSALIWSNHLILLQAIHYIGTLGLSLITLLACCALSMRYYSRKIICLLLGPLIVLGCLGFLRIKTAPTIQDNETSTTLHLIQGNISQAIKWNPQFLQKNIQTYKNLLETLPLQMQQQDIILFPETSYTQVILRDPIPSKEHFKDLISSIALDTQDLIILGFISYTNNQTYNSLGFLTNTHFSIPYDKIHLVPFGEFFPILTTLFPKYFSNFTSGTARPFLTPHKPFLSFPPFIPLICYESLLPIPFEKQAQWILNTSNDQWFVDFSGPIQFFYINRLRAIEEGLPFVRIAETGISGIIDPYGRILAKTTLNEKTTLSQKLPKALSRHAWQSFGKKYLVLLIYILFFLYYLSLRLAKH